MFGFCRIYLVKSLGNNLAQNLEKKCTLSKSVQQIKELHISYCYSGFLS